MMISAPLTEDFCGVEPVTHPPDIKETRPPLNLDKDLIENAHNRANLAILGGKELPKCVVTHSRTSINRYGPAEGRNAIKAR